MSYKVIIAGGREFNDYIRLCKVCDYYLCNKEDIEIVSGCARGADSLAIQYAKDRGYPIKKFPANWDLGKRAGYLRNVEMAEYGDALIAFWNEESRGTKHMIDIANNLNLKVRVCTY